MTFEETGKCSRCNYSDIQLSEYGVCANCWTEYDDDERNTLVSASGVVYRLEPKRSRFRDIIPVAIGAVLGNVIAWGILIACAQLAGVKD